MTMADNRKYSNRSNINRERDWSPIAISPSYRNNRSNNTHLQKSYNTIENNELYPSSSQMLPSALPGLILDTNAAND